MHQILEKPENVRENVLLKDFVPLDQLRNYLYNSIGTIAILESTASEYSVPSKIMTYFCAGKPILAIVPYDNQVSEYIIQSNAGFVINGEDYLEAFNAAALLIENSDVRRSMGENARKFAVTHFSGERAALLFLRRMHLSGTNNQ